VEKQKAEREPGSVFAAGLAQFYWGTPIAQEMVR